MNASVIGFGSTKFREHWELGIKDMIREASKNALKSANVELKYIDSVFVANCFSSLINGQNNLNAVCSDMLGIDNSFSVGGGDSSGSYAILQAANAIVSGASKIALVIGVEKMSDLGTNDAIEAVSQFIDHENEADNGATLASLFAMITNKHMEEHGTTDKQLDMVSIKNHANAVENDIAQFRFNITRDDIIKSPMISTPLRVLHSAAYGDGCCAVVMCSSEEAKKHPIKIDLIGYGVGYDLLAVHEREDITNFNAVKTAAKKAFEKAKIKPEAISFAELHDAFSISEIISIEAIGFAKKGMGGKFIEEGKANLNGKTPINPSGGLKGCGHPLAATGIRQAIEAFCQLNNSAGNRQVKNPKYALTETISGTGATAVVIIFSK